MPNTIFTFLEMATEVADEFGSTDSASISKAKTWINRTLMNMSKFNWSWRIDEDQDFTTANGVEDYALDPSVKEIRSLYIKDPTDRKLRLVGDREFRRLVPDPSENTGDPTMYRDVGFDPQCRAIKVKLYPIPDSSIRIFVDAFTQIPLMSQSSDDIRKVSGVPQQFIDVILLGATTYGYRILGDTQYTQAKQEYNQEVTRLWDLDGTRIDESMEFGRIGIHGDFLDPVSAGNLG